MENSPRRSRSLTFDIPIMLGSSYPPAMNFVDNGTLSVKDSLLAFGSKLIRPNVFPQSCSKDDTEHDKKDEHGVGKNKFLDTTSNSRSKKVILDSMMGMFGSVKSFVRKLPNVVSNLNEELSVTVVSNGDNIPSRDLYVSVPLSSKENIKMNRSDMDMNTSMKENNDLDFSGISTTSEPTRRFYSEIFSKPRINLRHKKFLSADNIYRQTWTEHPKHAEELFVDVAFEAACEESIGNNLFSSNIVVDTETEILVTQQSESMNIGKEEDFDLLDLPCPNSVPEMLENDEMIQEESLEISKSMLEERASIKCQYTSRTQQISESSVESDDSFIVFKEPLNSEYCSTSGDEDDDDSDDSDNDSYDKFTTEFKSKSDYRSRRSSESSADSDSFIVFEENSSPKCLDDNSFIGCENNSSLECLDGVTNPVENDSSVDEMNDQKLTKVQFNLKPLIYTMIKWNYAYRTARKGPWEEMARDRERFRGRINSIGRVINPILTAEHRQSIWQIRFAIQD